MNSVDVTSRTGIEKMPRFGNPDEDKISTSYAERLNLSVRMHVRRFTRLTNAHSKSARHHEAMIALFVAWYNFCRPNTALEGKTTPAMASGVAYRSRLEHSEASTEGRLMLWVDEQCDASVELQTVWLVWAWILLWGNADDLLF